ncbi:MAG: Vitamin B12 dependent methionine synthase activation subunit [Clostridia bacterium]|nr:Vitamin B12 dependent methionine synthase activation subunit [Clostridia bacterium]
MNVLSKIYPEPPISQKEILRYMGCADADKAVLALIESVLREALPLMHYRVCWRESELNCTERALTFASVTVESRDLCYNLRNCKRVLLFAATVGLELDRLIAKYSRISPSRAVALQALGAERVESLCDAFLTERKAVYGEEGLLMRPRFSPGYGDLPLSVQKDLFRLLDCPKKIGLSLNDSLLMSPTKSVTAVVGLYDAN